VTLSTATREDGIANPGQAPCRLRVPDAAHTEGPVDFSGLPTGFPNLDNKLKGLNPAEVIVLASRPAVGKTTLALKIAECVALGRDVNGCPMKGGHDRQHAVAVFSLECCLADLAKRMHCGISNVATVHGKAPVIVDDTGGLDIMDICARARCMKKSHKIELIIIDYFQLCNCSEFVKHGFNRITRKSTEIIIEQIKDMAKELNIPVIVLSQLCRGCEMRGDNPGRLSHAVRPEAARCDACIVQEADAVLRLSRPNRVSGLSGRDDDVVIVDVTKNSNGPTGEVRIDFDPVESVLFVEKPIESGEVSSEIVLIDFNNAKGSNTNHRG